MNEFLDKHGYRIYEGQNFVMIRHYSKNLGCVHFLFITLIASLVLISVFLIFYANSWGVSIIAFLTLAIYFYEIDRRRKEVRRLFVNYHDATFSVKKGKNQRTYSFNEVVNVVSTSDHIGGYASSDRDTTEEFRRDVNILFKDGFILTVFSFISDHEEPEIETNQLVTWLESAVRLS